MFTKQATKVISYIIKLDCKVVNLELDFHFIVVKF